MLRPAHETEIALLRHPQKGHILKYYQVIGLNGGSRLCTEVAEGVLTDLTSVDEDLTAIDDLALAASLSGTDVDALARAVLESGDPDTYSLSEIVEGSRAGGGEMRLDRPIEPPEVWAAGVTYRTSEMERRRESDTPDIYSKVYTAERPELFLKATPERCVGPFESVGIRADSSWNVPEPELAFVLYKGKILGYTIGNDMSSRSIEGEHDLEILGSPYEEARLAVVDLFPPVGPGLSIFVLAPRGRPIARFRVKAGQFLALRLLVLVCQLLENPQSRQDL
jgi:hypothetical protein